MVELWIVLALFTGIFLQGVVGFGMALVALPLLSMFIDISVAAPLLALAGSLAKILMLVYYREEVRFKPVLGLSAASLVFIPVGVVAMDYINKDLALAILGVVVVVYALYSLFKFRLPDFDRPFWMVVFGSIGGFLGGAFNTAGPPVIMYANAKDWSPQEFKSNLQGYALITGLFILISHWLKGNITPQVWHSFLYSIPAAVLAVVSAVSLDRFINKEFFRVAVLVVLLGVGVKLVY
jgi:uncharacterized membrane protein YfcA